MRHRIFSHNAVNPPEFWRIDGLGEKMTRTGGFIYPYSPSPTPHRTMTFHYSELN